MIDAIRSEDPIRSKIEALGTTLSLPTVRKALGILEGAHASDKRFGADDVMVRGVAPCRCRDRRPGSPEVRVIEPTAASKEERDRSG